MSKIPEVYAEWIPILDDFATGRNDKETITAMQQGKIYWCDVVEKRLLNRIKIAFDERIRLAGEKFSKAQDEGIPIEQALNILKREWNLIFAAAQMGVFSEDAKQKFMTFLDQAADKTQNSLENSAKGDLSGELSVILRRLKSGRK